MATQALTELGLSARHEGEENDNKSDLADGIVSPVSFSWDLDLGDAPWSTFCSFGVKQGDHSLASPSPYIDDPTATYRGYRRQALYALFRLFDDGLPADFTLEPEGNEDLAVYDAAGKLVEIVQVKDFSDNLTASKFKPTFYARIAQYCEPGSAVEVRIVSFGPVGTELESAVRDGVDPIPSRVLDTLTKDRETKRKLPDGTTSTVTVPGLSMDKAKNVLRHIAIEKVDERELTVLLERQLAATITSGDPKQAFNNLMWWLLTSSERQTRLDRRKAITCLEQIGRFLSHRAAHHHEWNISIIPLQAADDLTDKTESLRQEFFRGGRVRIEHIAANIDVPRDRYLGAIHSFFDRDNVVIVHAASGQGKTTLAYRYILDFAPSEFRFEVLAASDLQHARRLAAAITGHSEAISVPTLVYVDVRPGDNMWVEIVRTLASVVGIRVLVTIREEDWTRARITQAEFSFAELTLDFGETEARGLYDVFQDGTATGVFLDFDDTWAQFGRRRTLFEFVYFITQEQTLARRITSQVQSLQDAANRGDFGKGEIELLRLVAVASAYEARLKVNLLASSCDVAEPKRTLERFSDEYLLRTSDDGRFVEGFHSIRSEIMCDQLIDEVTHPWSDAARRCLPLIDEDDLEGFLLCSFSRHPQEAGALVTALADFCPESWIGIRGVFLALTWNGIRKYLEQNAELIKNVRQAFSSGWWFVLDWDLAQICGDKGFQLFEQLKNMSKEMAFASDASQSLRDRQTDKNAVFDDVIAWLDRIESAPEQVTDPAGLAAMAEVLYWVSHLDSKSRLRDCISGRLIDRGYDLLPMHLFGEFVVAIQKCNFACYDSWLAENGERLIPHLRRELSVMATEDTGDALIAHYAIDLDRKASMLRQRSSEVGDAASAINDLSVERVEVISQCLPGKARYGAAGYGHRMSLIDLHDESIKAIPIENIMMPWLPQFNAVARGFAEMQFRPKTWTEYFDAHRSMREHVLVALDDLRAAIRAIRPGSTKLLKDADGWDRCKHRLNGEFLLPASSVDEWGFVTESTGQRMTTELRRERFTSVSRLKRFNKAVNEYTRTVSNFMQQALDALVLIPNLRAAKGTAARQKVLAEAKKLKLNEASVRLSVINGVDACAAVRELQRLGKELGDGDPGLNLEPKFLKRERDQFWNTMRAWCIFTHPNQAAKKTKKTNRRRSVRTPSFDDLLSATRKRVSEALKRLRTEGYDASIHTDNVPWNDESAVFLTCSASHPLASIAAIDRVWYALVDAFAPDRNKIVPTKAIDLFWSNIVLVMLVHGKSLEGQALPNFKAVTYPEVPNIDEQAWRLIPEEVPAETWAALRLPRWDRQDAWDVFDRFAAAYGMLFHHVDHMSDFNRCEVELDELGESIVQDYISREVDRAQPFLQETFDACADLCNAFPDLDDDVIEARPNLLDCRNLVVEMKDSILPTSDFHEQARLTIKDTVDWRNRLRASFENLGLARYLWIADSLGFPAYEP